MSVPLTPEFSKTLTYLQEVEAVAQDILTLKETKLKLSNTLNKLRESHRALQGYKGKNSILRSGSLLFHYETKKCIELILEDMKTVKEEYELTSEKLKEKLNEMRDIEHQPQIVGMGLKPLTYKESEAIMKGFGIK